MYLYQQRLYNLGARKLVVVGLGPIGCMPSIITINGFTNTRTIDSQGCVEEVDQMVSYFNDGLSEVIQNLRSTLPDFIISQGSIHQLIKDVLANPSKYGNISLSPFFFNWDFFIYLLN